MTRASCSPTPTPTPTPTQLLTCGTDRKLTYWDVTDMNAIRIVDGSESAEINTLDISHDGHFFVSGGADKKVKLWHYQPDSPNPKPNP